VNAAIKNYEAYFDASTEEEF